MNTTKTKVGDGPPATARTPSRNLLGNPPWRGTPERHRGGGVWVEVKFQRDLERERKKKRERESERENESFALHAA